MVSTWCRTVSKFQKYQWFRTELENPVIDSIRQFVPDEADVSEMTPCCHYTEKEGQFQEDD